MIITVSMNPAVDKTITVEQLSVGSVNRILSSRWDPGGKAINVAKMIHRFGGETLAMGIIGGKNGAYIQEQLDAVGLPHDFLVVPGETRMNYKIIDQKLHTTTDINDPGVEVNCDILEEMWKKINAAAKPGDTVVLAGSNPPGMPDDTLANWISMLNAKGVTTALDTTGGALRLAIEAKPTVIKPNSDELSEIYGEGLHYVRDIIVAAREIVQKGVERVVVSMGGEGALFVTKDEVLRGYGVKVPLKSSVGAGDAMLASIVYSLQKGRDWTETAKRSIAAGTANVMCDGTQTPTLELLDSLLDKITIEKLF